MDGITNASSKAVPLRIGDKVADIHPIRLRDWPEFAPVLFALEMENLHEVHSFIDGPGALFTALKLLCRKEELPDTFDDMTQSEYHSLREIIIKQNELDFDKLHKKIEEIDKAVKEKVKKAQPPL